MKDKIFIFIIGLLVGAVISTGAFYIYTKTNSGCNNQNMQMNGGEPPELPGGGQGGGQGEPPEKPDGETGEPPEKPSDNNNQKNNTQDNK